MHKPVLLKEVTSLASEVEAHNILDATFGRGGHTRALLEANPQAKVTALDQDLEAVQFAKTAFPEEIRSGRLSVQHFNFHNVAELQSKNFDVILLDLGVSSPQLDQAERGFSFYNEGPLDMRMNQDSEIKASDIVNSWSEVELNELFLKLGEVRRPQRVVRAIVNDRVAKPYSNTRELASLIERVEGWRKKGQHPATQYFLALRMEVNRELSGLEACLPDLMRSLSETGRLMIITFHSLEDRIIKYAFKEATTLGYPLFKKVIVPSKEECSENPRARSAKLRIFQRGLQNESSTTKRYSPVS